MPTKTLIMLGMVVGSILGGYIPTLFGAGIFSYWSIVTSSLGAVLGIWLGYKLSNY